MKGKRGVFRTPLAEIAGCVEASEKTRGEGVQFVT